MYLSYRVWALASANAEDQTPRLVAYVGGTLLGAAFAPDGGLYLADATRGLLFISANESIPAIGKARIVAAMAPSDPQLIASKEGLSTAEIRYANDVSIDASTGNVYFTDSTRVAPIVLSDRIGQVCLFHSIFYCDVRRVCVDSNSSLLLFLRDDCLHRERRSGRGDRLTFQEMPRGACWFTCRRPGIVMFYPPVSGLQTVSP